MKVSESGKCLSYFVESFKSELQLKKPEKIVYMGSKGVCFSMAQLFGYSVRDFVKNQYFIPETEINKSVEYELTDIGYRFFGISNIKKLNNPDYLIIMGGIATKHSNSTPEDARLLIKKIVPEKIVGISICNVLKTSGWAEKIDFDIIIDGTLDPVTVYKK
ncbi:conserved hypothetical protein [Methanococcus vannielii SB]|uniref:DUF2124 domain-containing protein n=1 Tax=Methanococcus vannielii (strain ATCC 35089 / DSM 1224 / JCM 13029 / OCM 148 / SB) TaxID=406327 RepID=A6US61_METVS|nr:DUF2124 family protein [Methanococcus vannielii]ABR55333.1 conserved hypothetical protein [Methanococcus vannielii SB]